MSSLCLNMIVKNEAAIIEECLDSVANCIDYFVVCDTGSSDDTVERIRAWGERQGIEGEVHVIEFGDFSRARNEALERARASGRCDYVLFIDADMRLVATREHFVDLTDEAYYLRQQSGGMSYYNIRLLRRDGDSKYVGATHEVVWVNGSIGRLNTPWMIDLACGANRVEKYERDLRLLAAEHEREPDNARTLFYTAQTYKDMERYPEAIEWYRTRVEAGGWAEEQWYAQMMIGACMLDAEELSTEAGLDELRKAYEMRPSRAEPIYRIAQHYRLASKHQLAWIYAQAGLRARPSDDMLFVDSDAYRFGFREEASISGFYVDGGRAEATRYCSELAVETDVPDHIREVAHGNLRYYTSLASEVLSPIVRSSPGREELPVPTAEPVRLENAALRLEHLVHACPPVSTPTGQIALTTIADPELGGFYQFLVSDTSGQRISHPFTWDDSVRVLGLRLEEPHLTCLGVDPDGQLRQLTLSLAQVEAFAAAGVSAKP